MSAPLVSPGGYRFLPGAAPFSAGVAAQPGFAIERVEFPAPVPLVDGLRLIRARVKDVETLCAVELRSPAPLSLDGFAAFNRPYVEALKSWGLFQVDGLNPVARVNVCPAVDPPSTPSVHAFAFTRRGAARGFIISGVAEVPDGKGSYPARIVRRGDVSPDGLREKAAFVKTELERRMSALGASWAEATAVRYYSAHAPPAGLPEGTSWERARPPLLDLELELDVRSTQDTRYT